MKFIFLFIFIVFLCLPQQTVAKGKHSLSAYQKHGRAFAIKNPQQAAKLVRSRFGGKVLKVSTKKVNGRVAYRVKLIKKDGHIVSVLVDAQSGQIKG